MKSKILWFLVFFFFLLPILSSKTLSVGVVVYLNDSKGEIRYAMPSEAVFEIRDNGPKGEYKIELVDANGKVLSSSSFSVGSGIGSFDYVEGGESRRFNRVFYSLSLTYFSSAKKVILKKGNNILDEYIIEGKECDRDGHCESEEGEDAISCPVDCSPFLDEGKISHKGRYLRGSPCCLFPLVSAILLVLVIWKS